MSISNPTQREQDSQADRRLAEMVLFVAERCQSDSKFGATKLNKILFFADAMSFIQRGKPIIGCEFMKLGQGPVPRRLVPVRENLINAGRAVVQKKTLVPGREQHRLIPLDQPKLDAFTPDDIKFLDEVIGLLCDRSAAEVSELSHRVPAWEIAEDKETIPLEAAFIQSVDHTDSDVSLALSFFRK